jgi:hypothetical protein
MFIVTTDKRVVLACERVVLAGKRVILTGEPRWKGRRTAQ